MILIGRGLVLLEQAFTERFALQFAVNACQVHGHYLRLLLWGENNYMRYLVRQYELNIFHFAINLKIYLHMSFFFCNFVGKCVQSDNNGLFTKESGDIGVEYQHAAAGRGI